jgi:hypothetical protein
MAAESTRQLQRLIRHAGLFTRPGTATCSSNAASYQFSVLSNSMRHRYLLVCAGTGATGGVTAATAAAAAATFLPVGLISVHAQVVGPEPFPLPI